MNHTAAACVSCLLLAVAVQGCGAAEEAPAPPPTAEPTAPEPQPAPAAATTAPDPQAGEKSYAVFCASCHGIGGDGVTPFAEALDPPPTVHRDGTYMNGLSDAHLFRVIKEGGAAVGKAPTMAAWGGTLSDEQILNVVAYIRTLAVPRYEPSTP